MPYPLVRKAAAEKQANKYKLLKDDLPNKTGNALKQHTAQMQSVGTKGEEALNAAIKTLAGYYDTFEGKVNKWHADAASELKFAKQAAAKYKSKPESSVAAALQRHIQELKRFHDEYKQELHDYTQSWTEIRPWNPGTLLDKKYITQFTLERSKLISGLQGLLLKGNQLKAMHQEGKALLAIVTKAMVKSNRQDAGLVRPAALTAATDLEAKLSKMLTQITTPGGSTPKPDAISGSGLTTLRGMATTAALLQDKNDLALARGAWTTTNTAYQSMVTKHAAMAKLLDTHTKGLRSTEKADPTIKQKLKDAAKHVTDAKNLIKARDKDYAASKKYMQQIEAQAKKLKIS